MLPKNKIIALARKFLRRQDGGMTILGLYFFMFMAIFSAFAVDGMNISMSQVHLQKAADQAAHAALYNRSYAGNFGTADEAKQKAIDVVSATLPPARFGTSIEITDIEFGSYDGTTFTPDPNGTQAARATTSFTRGRLNQLNMYLFHFVGFDSINLARSAVYEIYLPGCLREGFIADGPVDVQSNNNFSQGFCVHSNTSVSMNNNNTFEAGTIVSMTDLDALDLPSAGFESNVGLGAALRQGTMNLRVLNRIDDMIALYKDPAADVAGDTPPLPDYILSPTPIRLNERLIETTMIDKITNAPVLAPGFVYDVSCPGQTLRIDANVTLRNVVIVTDCDITFTNGTAGSSFENVIILTSSTDERSITSPAGLRLGAKDGCQDGGGAVIGTMGGMNFVAGVEMYGSQFLAMKQIHFNANAIGEGSSLVAGWTIDGTSNMDMKLCGNGTGDAFELDYFRMVQ